MTGITGTTCSGISNPGKDILIDKFWLVWLAFLSDLAMCMALRVGKNQTRLRNGQVCYLCVGSFFICHTTCWLCGVRDFNALHFQPNVIFYIAISFIFNVLHALRIGVVMGWALSICVKNYI